MSDCYELMKPLEEEHSVSDLCEVFAVSRSGYYGWKSRGPSEREREDERIAKAIRRIDSEVKSRYGRPRIHRQLRCEGIRCGQKRVHRLMKENGIKARRKRPWRPKTTIGSGTKCSLPGNRLANRPAAAKPNEIWVGDITYIPTREGWLYLAAVMDRFTRKITGHAVADHMKESLVRTALEGAVKRYAPAEGLLHHSDRGSQYTSGAYQALLADLKIEPSFSRTGNCYDNAAMESFFASFKTELLPESGVFETKDQARREIFAYIEIFYNRKRLHSALDYQSPVDFENNLNYNLN